MYWDDKSFKQLLRLQIFFRLRQAKNITCSQEIYINWNRILRPLLGSQIFSRLRRAKKHNTLSIKSISTGTAYRDILPALASYLKQKRKDLDDRI